MKKIMLSMALVLSAGFPAAADPLLDAYAAQGLTAEQRLMALGTVVNPTQPASGGGYVATDTTQRGTTTLCSEAQGFGEVCQNY